MDDAGARRPQPGGPQRRSRRATAPASARSTPSCTSTSSTCRSPRSTARRASCETSSPTILTIPRRSRLLAKHYSDIQNKTAEIRTLERLFALAPSLPTARDLLAHYRLEGAFDREEGLLRTLLANQHDHGQRCRTARPAAGRARRPLRRARRAHPLRRDRQPGAQHRTARSVRRAGADRRQDDRPEQGRGLDRALAQGQHASPRRLGNSRRPVSSA